MKKIIFFMFFDVLRFFCDVLESVQRNSKSHASSLDARFVSDGDFLLDTSILKKIYANIKIASKLCFLFLKSQLFKPSLATAEMPQPSRKPTGCIMSMMNTKDGILAVRRHKSRLSGMS